MKMVRVPTARARAGDSPFNQEPDATGAHFAENNCCPFATSYFKYSNTLNCQKYYLPVCTHAAACFTSLILHVIPQLLYYVHDMSNIYFLFLFLLPHRKMPHLL